MSELQQYSIEDIMHLPLPNITCQKRLLYRPHIQDILHVYSLINESVFRNELSIPEIMVKPYRQKYWGMCIGEAEIQKNGTYCRFDIMDKYYCPQWLVTIIAHEMVHQYQWDIEGPKRQRKGKHSLMSHGPSFFKFRDRLSNFGVPLKTAHSMRKWFKYQDMFKC